MKEYYDLIIDNHRIMKTYYDLINNGVLYYEPFGSYYCVDNDGELFYQPMSVSDSGPIKDWDEWTSVDFFLLEDKVVDVLKDIRHSLNMATTMGDEEFKEVTDNESDTEDKSSE